MAPLVTVILPAYNAEDTIEKSIYSILYQSYENIELIIVDDHSSDRTLEIATHIADDRVRVIQMQHNSGVYNCRNVALSLARGEYLTFQDADDISDPYRLQKSVDALADDTVVMTYGQYIRYTPDYEIVRRDNFNCMVTMMIKRRVLDDIGYLDTVCVAGDSEYFKRIHVYYASEQIVKVFGFMYYALDSVGLTKQFAFSSPARLSYVEDYSAWHKNQNVYIALDAPSRAFEVTNTEILADKNVTAFVEIALSADGQRPVSYSKADYLAEVNRINESWLAYVTYLKRSVWYKLNKLFVAAVNFLRFKLSR